MDTLVMSHAHVFPWVWFFWRRDTKNRTISTRYAIHGLR